MKLKATFNIEAQDRLHRNLLPALEKMGKTAQLLLQRDHIMFVQLQDDGTEGGLVKLELPSEYIFSNLKIESNKDNKIAFQVSIPLLLKIFAAAATIEADSMQMLLAQTECKNEDGSIQKTADGTVIKQPILRFHCIGMLHATTQELPIAKPYTGAQIDDLLATLDVLSLMDWYVNLQPHVHKVEALLATVGRHAPFVRLLAMKTGETHVQIETDAVVQGLELAPLEVFPETFQAPPPSQPAATPDARLLAAVAAEGDDAPRVEVCTKGVSKALAACAVTAPDFLLLSCGDADRQVMHLMCTFRTAGGDVNADAAMHIWMLSRAADD